MYVAVTKAAFARSAIEINAPIFGIPSKSSSERSPVNRGGYRTSADMTSTPRCSWASASQFPPSGPEGTVPGTTRWTTATIATRMANSNTSPHRDPYN